MNLRGKTALITGGCGLLGSTIADRLVGEEGIGRLIILDNLTRGTLLNIEQARKRGRVELIQNDIRHFDQIRPHFEGVDIVFHQAAIRITACAEKPRECLEVLIDGTFNVLEACVAAKVEKVVAASSASIYGAAEIFPTREDHHPYGNRTLYGAAKVANEGMLRAFNDMYGLPYVALRYFNVYGPRMDVFGKYTEVLIRWLDCLDRGERPKIFGDGQTSMDFIFSEDVARANILAARSELSDDVLNVASATETTLLELLEALLAVTGQTHVKPEFLAERAVNPVPRRLADVEGAAAKIGFRAQVDLHEGLRRLVAWRKEAIAARNWKEYAE
jgi:UDP-glucose 4-epimerase